MLTLSRPIQPSFPQVLFSASAATEAAEIGTEKGGFLKRGPLKREMAKTKIPYLGYIPEVFSKYGLEDAEVWEKFNDLSIQLRGPKIPFWNVRKKLKAFITLLREEKVVPQPLDFDLGPGIPPLPVTPVGEGMFARVFKVTFGGEKFALKIFRRRWEVLRNGPFWECAVGLYLTNRHVRDVVKTFMGRPDQGWYLAEFIDEDSIPLEQREGPTAKEVGVQFIGEKPENRIRGIRIDLGTAWFIHSSFSKTAFYMAKGFRAVTRPVYHQLTGQ